MKWAATALVAALVAGCATGETPTAIALMPPAGWVSDPEPGICEIRTGDIALATRDGEQFMLGIYGGRTTILQARDALFGRERVILVVQPAKNGVAAILDAGALDALQRADAISVSWPDKVMSQTIPESRSAVGLLRACGTRLSQAWRELSAKREAQAAFAERLFLAGRAMQGSTPPAPGGLACFKSREWTSGFNKNCAYDCLGSEAVQTIGATQLCPLQIAR